MKPQTTYRMPTELTKSLEQTSTELIYSIRLFKIELQLELLKFKYDFILWFAMMLVVQTVVIVALVKLL
jgi:hypothetical protein